MITLEPIGVVRSPRKTTEDDYWGAVTSAIELCGHLDADSLRGLDEFSHAEIVYWFDRVDESRIVTGARHPRGNTAWPSIGIFAQRAKNRPNRIGLSTVAIVRLQQRTLYVRNLDAIDGTPVLDIKPVMAEFLPQGPIRQPEWSHDLMKQYWLPEHQRPLR